MRDPLPLVKLDPIKNNSIARKNTMNLNINYIENITRMARSNLVLYPEKSQDYITMSHFSFFVCSLLNTRSSTDSGVISSLIKPEPREELDLWELRESCCVSLF